MHVKQINRLHAQARQTAVKFALQMGCRIVMDVTRPVGITLDRGLGGDGEMIAGRWMRRQIAANNTLRCAHAINIGGVDMIHPRRHRRVQNGMAAALVCRSIEIGKRHRSDAHRMHKRAVCA